MSLEQAIQAHTAALIEQTNALKDFVAALKIPVQPTQEKAVATPIPVKPSATLKPVEQKSEAVVVEESLDAELEGEIEEALRETVSTEKLPAGKRDEKYRETHVSPHLLELRKVSDKDTLVALLASFNVQKASDIPSDKWDEVVAKAKEEILKHSV
jgi:TPP-dependent indolepyruvate ferredoxin oxidoreductase alpha subunit